MRKYNLIIIKGDKIIKVKESNNFSSQKLAEEKTSYTTQDLLKKKK
jgi:hypothetical protein